MEIIKSLINRFWPTGILFVTGFVVIIYIAFGFLYFQQGAKQEELEKQTAKISIVISKPLPSAEKLQTEYDKVNSSLSPLAVPVALDIIVGIAEKSEIDIDEDAGKLYIPPPTFSQVKMGEGNYQILSFKNIRARGDYDSVMAFISDLDSGTTLQTMVLERIDISQTGLEIKAVEIARRTEARDVTLAVRDMMVDNGLSEIPAPLDYAGGIATNDMGLTSTTGFPDNTTSFVDRGYTGTEVPRDGYVLYEHDKITVTNTDNFTTVSYITVPETEYYYTCEADGTVRQFDGPDVATATEYPSNEREARRTEIYNVSLAVRDMMDGNGLSEIPAPLDYAGGIATNDMGSKLTTGFPDNTTPFVDKGYTGIEVPRNGYVLYKHDKISTDNTTHFETVSYITVLTTKYYYTCEANGTVRQFDGPDVATAMEYLDIETVAVLNVDIYTKPLEGD